MLRFFMWLCFLLPISAYAGNVGQGGFASGFWHPILGFDHLLAMFAVGLISVHAQASGGIYKVPAVFVIVMALGGVAAMAGVKIPEVSNISVVENIIWTSSLLLGLLIALTARPSMLLTMVLVAIFAFFHGYAHGAEMPSASEPLAYIAGFMVATILIHIAGVFIGEACRLGKNPIHLRNLLGAAIAGIGLYITLLNNNII